MAEEKKRSEEKKSLKNPRLENLPESLKKNIMVVVISVLMLTVIILWLITFVFKVKNIKSGDQSSQGLQKIKQEAEEIIDLSTKTFDQFKNQFNLLQRSVTAPTTSLGLSNEDVEKIKDKLLENKAENTNN